MRLYLIIVILVFGTACQLAADTGSPGPDRAFSNTDGTFFFFLQPAIFDPDSFLMEHMKREYGMNVIKKRDQCVGTLLKADKERNTYTTVWNAALAENATPDTVMISPDGAHVITLSNSPDAATVVLYDNHGEVVVNYPLSAFLTQAEIEAAPQSISSVNWQGTHSIDRKRNVLLLQVRRIGPDHSNMDSLKPDFRTVTIDLKTGKIIDDGRKS